MVEYEFSSREDASAAVAKRITECAAEDLATYDSAAFVVSGGTTPVQAFDILSVSELDWPSVRVLLSDERWVPADHDASNERMVRERLATNAAADVDVLGVFQAGATVSERCETLQVELENTEFSCSLVGMGTDGHFASLFPDSDALTVGLDRNTSQIYIPAETGASEYGRVSMTLAALLRSREILLLCFGDEKRQVLSDASANETRYPIGRLLHQEQTPVRLYWAP